MPERPLLVAAYAAGAGLAAATLVYVLGPTFLPDEASNGRGHKSKHVVGLSNPANDCFINSTLQALAGSPQLRNYLMKETYLRKMLDADDGLRVSSTGAMSEKVADRTQRNKATLIAGLITNALKSMLDSLNERPLSRKTISAQPVITAVERAFNTRVSRYQQDAQEFLQLLLERLADEHKEFNRAYEHTGKALDLGASHHDVHVVDELLEDLDLEKSVANEQKERPSPENMTAEERHEAAPVQDDTVSILNDTVPFQGKMESQIECMTCHFQPTASKSDFVTLTLNVPHGYGSTTLDTCFDGALKVEHIDGFRCDRCRLVYARKFCVASLNKRGVTAKEKDDLRQRCRDIEQAIEQDPEHPPPHLVLPATSVSPVSQITKHMLISVYPKLLTIHLSRSVWGAYSSSSKNLAKVSFQETLTLGPILDRKTYHLIAVVTHKGGHNSGHYETFRRLDESSPPTTSKSISAEGPYSSSTTQSRSPRVLATASNRESETEQSKSIVATAEVPTSPGLGEAIEQNDQTRGEGGQQRSSLGQGSKAASEKKSSPTFHASKAKKRQTDRWWRISDDKIKECRVADVLAMQREVYLLFYEQRDTSQSDTTNDKPL